MKKQSDKPTKPKPAGRPREAPKGEVDAIARACSRRREELGMSVAELAEKVGVAGPSLSNWFNGRRQVTAATAAAVMKALGFAVT